MKLHPLVVLPLAAALIVPIGATTMSSASESPHFSRPAGHEPEGLVVNTTNHRVFVSSEYLEGPPEVTTGPEVEDVTQVEDDFQTLVFGPKLKRLETRRSPGDWEYGAFDPGLNRVYTANKGLRPGVKTPVVQAWTGTTGAKIGKMKVPRLVGVAVDTGNHRIFASSKAPGVGANQTKHGKIFVFDENLNLLKKMWAGDDPEAIAVNSTTHRLYAANEDDGTVMVYKTGGLYRIKTINLWPGCKEPVTKVETEPEFCEADKMAIDEDLNKTYVTDDFKTVFVIKGHHKAGKFTIAGARRSANELRIRNMANNIAVDSHTHNIYVASEQKRVTEVNAYNWNDRRNLFIDTADVPSAGRRAALLKVREHIDAIGVDPTLHRLYVTDENRGTITRVAIP